MEYVIFAKNTDTLEKTNDVLDVFMKAESMCIYISTQPFSSIMICIRFVVKYYAVLPFVHIMIRIIFIRHQYMVTMGSSVIGREGSHG